MRLADVGLLLDFANRGAKPADLRFPYSTSLSALRNSPRLLPWYGAASDDGPTILGRWENLFTQGHLPWRGIRIIQILRDMGQLGAKYRQEGINPAESRRARGSQNSRIVEARTF